MITLSLLSKIGLEDGESFVEVDSGKPLNGEDIAHHDGSGELFFRQGDAVYVKDQFPEPIFLVKNEDFGTEDREHAVDEG
jgi:hypothetical protein